MNFHTMDIGQADPDGWIAFDGAEDVQFVQFDPQFDHPHQTPEPEPVDFQQWQPQQPTEPQDMMSTAPSTDAVYGGVPLKKTVSAERTGSGVTAKTHPETPPRRQKKHTIEYGTSIPMPTMVAKNLSSDTDSNSKDQTEDLEQPSFRDEDKSNNNNKKKQAPKKPSRRICMFCLVWVCLLFAIAGALGVIVYLQLFHEVGLATDPPSTEPSLEPTPAPTSLPTSRPTIDSARPTMFWTPAPTTRPPTSPPSRSPSRVPSVSPTDNPSYAPSSQPTTAKDDLRDLLDKITDGRTVQATSLPGSPQHKAYEWVHNDPAYFEFKERRIVQRFVMAVLYYTTAQSESAMEAMASWMDYDTNECTWFTSWYNNRFACGSDDVFKTLALRNVALTGTIPSELALLTHLNTLVLSDNLLTGSLPKEFGEWTSLMTLNVHSNFLTGSIPLFTNSPSLQEINLGSNRLTGNVPASIANLNLTSLDLAENNVQGIIPPGLCSTPEQTSQLELVTVDCDQVSCFCCTQCGANRTRAPVMTPFTPPPSQAPAPSPNGSCITNIQVSKTCYKVGEPVEVTFTNCNPRAGDWLGLYDAESPAQSLMDPLLWHWSCGSKSCSGSPIQGGSTLDASSEGQGFWPLNRGNYEVYLIRAGANFPYQSVSRSGEFRVAQRICPD